MAIKKPTETTFRFVTVYNGNPIAGRVSFSPAPEVGILTAIAELEAKRMLNQILIEEIAAGRL